MGQILYLQVHLEARPLRHLTEVPARLSADFKTLLPDVRQHRYRNRQRPFNPFSTMGALDGKTVSHVVFRAPPA